MCTWQEVQRWVVGSSWQYLQVGAWSWISYGGWCKALLSLVRVSCIPTSNWASISLHVRAYYLVSLKRRRSAADSILVAISHNIPSLLSLRTPFDLWSLQISRVVRTSSHRAIRPLLLYGSKPDTRLWPLPVGRGFVPPLNAEAIRN